jgi:hypothetical protein
MKNGIPVIFNMATMPPRIPALEETIPYMLRLCDELHIYLNEFETIPPILLHEKIHIYRSQDHLGDMGDVGKFFTCADWHKKDAYIFTVDDKLIYPPDYVDRSVEAIELYGRKAVISFHGRNLKANCRSYYFDATSFFGVLSSVPVDQFAHELGTGAMSYHSSQLKINLSIFPTINMTDILFSIFLQKKKIPILIRNHTKGWVGISTRHDDDYSIHAICNKNDGYQTEVVNGFKWINYKCDRVA